MFPLIYIQAVIPRCTAKIRGTLEQFSLKFSLPNCHYLQTTHLILSFRELVHFVLQHSRCRANLAAMFAITANGNSLL